MNAIIMTLLISNTGLSTNLYWIFRLKANTPTSRKIGV